MLIEMSTRYQYSKTFRPGRAIGDVRSSRLDEPRSLGLQSGESSRYRCWCFSRGRIFWPFARYNRTKGGKAQLCPKALLRLLRMKVSDFDYHLPEELIAQEPVEPRDASRLLVVHRETGALRHRVFRDIIEYLEPSDVLVINDTKVIPARLFGIKKENRARVEVLLLRRISQDVWEVLLRPGRRVPPGTWLEFGDGVLTAKWWIQLPREDGFLEFIYQGVFEAILDNWARCPYHHIFIKSFQIKSVTDGVCPKRRFSRSPYRRLHFTPGLLDRIARRGVALCFLTLHVGLGLSSCKGG